MELDYEIKDTQITSDYPSDVRAAEKVYKENLTPEMFNLGQELSDLAEQQNIAFNPKQWAAWMRKAQIYEQEHRVIVRVQDKKWEFFLEYIFKLYHNLLAKHFNKKVYYAGSGRAILDKAGYDFMKYENLTPEQKAENDALWDEARRNIRAFLAKSRKA